MVAKRVVIGRMIKTIKTRAIDPRAFQRPLQDGCPGSKTVVCLPCRRLRPISPAIAGLRCIAQRAGHTLRVVDGHHRACPYGAKVAVLSGQTKLSRAPKFCREAPAWKRLTNSQAKWLESTGGRSHPRAARQKAARGKHSCHQCCQRGLRCPEATVYLGVCAGSMRYGAPVRSEDSRRCVPNLPALYPSETKSGTVSDD